MSEYKILVKSVEEVEKAQTLFEKLGFRKGECTLYDLPKLVAAQHDPLLGTYSSGASLYFDSKNKYEWLSMEQLEDLVNHINDLEDSEIVAQSKSNEQGLISGADALRALADGEGVEVYMEIPNKLPKTKGWVDASVCSLVPFAFISPNLSFKFRLKPRTVKLEIEVPAPFEPKYGDYVFTIDSNATDGWTKFLYQESMERKIIYGAWRTETEIKIVVEQLRKLGVLK